MKRALCLTIVAALMILAGCDYHEINDHEIVAGVGIDVSEAGYEICLQCVDVGEEVASGMEPTLLYGTGDTLDTAAACIMRSLGKRLSYSHTVTLIIGNEAAAGGIERLLDWFVREGSLCLDMTIAVAAGEAAEVLECGSLTRTVSMYELAAGLSLAEEQGRIEKVDMYELLGELNHNERSTVLPLVQVRKTGETATAEVGGSAYFRGDRLAGTLGVDDSTYLQTMTRSLSDGLISTGEPETVMSIEESKPEWTVEYVDGAAEIKVVVAMRTALREGREYTNEDMAELQRRTCVGMAALVARMQGEACDVFGLYGKARGKTAAAEEEWQSEFARSRVTVSFGIELTDTGYAQPELFGGRT